MMLAGAADVNIDEVMLALYTGMICGIVHLGRCTSGYEDSCLSVIYLFDERFELIFNRSSTCSSSFTPGSFKHKHSLKFNLRIEYLG